PQPAGHRLSHGVRGQRLVLRVDCGGSTRARRQASVLTHGGPSRATRASPVRRQVMIEQHFGESSPFSLGVEEELMILDAATFEQVAAVDRILKGVEGMTLPGGIKTE